MIRDRLRTRLRAGRARGARWVRVLDIVRALGRPDGRAVLWTKAVHGRALHQTGGFTWLDRYPDLFALVSAVAPRPARILSFGCSTGEEIETLRRHFPSAHIVGAEINPRSRRAAARRMAGDARVELVAPQRLAGPFDLVFALAVLQVEPHRIERDGIADLSSIYPFDRFDRTVVQLADMLPPGGLLCVMHAQYRVEDSGAAHSLDAIAASPPLEMTLFGRDGRRLAGDAVARSVFRKR